MLYSSIILSTIINNLYELECKKKRFKLIILLLDIEVEIKPWSLVTLPPKAGSPFTHDQKFYPLQNNGFEYFF